MAGVTLYPYSGDPLDDVTWRTALGLTEGRPFTLLVPTRALAGVRETLANDPAMSHQQTVAGATLVFHEALRHFMGPGGVISRSEERILVKRVMETLSAHDAARQAQLKHDVFAWRDTLTDLAQRGIDLANGYPVDLEDRLVNQWVGTLLRDLQIAYTAEQERRGQRSFEAAARKFLAERFQPTPTVVMEGFTLLTPLQEYFIRICQERGADIKLLFPYHHNQKSGFASIRRVYGIPDKDIAVVNNTAIKRKPCLARLRDGLFSTASISPPPPDGSVTLEAYRHRHQEVEACVNRLKKYIEDDNRHPKEIVVVVPDPAAFRPILLEEAQFQDLGVSLSIPPRMLLLTPLGRFALTLYEVWHDGALKMTDEQFEGILASGWLGANFQATVEQFSALRAQLFARCETRDDWDDALNETARLHEELPEDSRIPVVGIKKRSVQLWRDALQQTSDLCARLFANKTKTMGQHIKTLLDELSQLDPDLVREAEREIVQQIFEALQFAGTSSQLEMSPEEFRDVLNGMVRESEQDDVEGEQQEVEGRIWIASPEGVDGTTRNIVILLGADNCRMPRGLRDPWPFYDRDVEVHLERERYRFLAVVRAARERLHISFSEADERNRYQPSLFMEEASALLGMGINRIDETQRAEISIPQSQSPKLLRAKRDEYVLAEIAHFALCPFRYKMECLDARGREYTDKNQMGKLAQSRWMELTLNVLVQRGHTARTEAQKLAMFVQAKANVKSQVEQEFRGIHPVEWITVARKMDRDWSHITNTSKGYELRVAVGSEPVYDLVNRDQAVAVKAPVRFSYYKGPFRHPFLSDQLFEEWLLPGRKPRDPNVNASVTIGGLQLFSTQYHAVQWWRNATTAAFNWKEIHPSDKFRNEKHKRRAIFAEELDSIITRIESGRFPKHRGDHCHQCPVRSDCLGLEP